MMAFLLKLEPFSQTMNAVYNSIVESVAVLVVNVFVLSIESVRQSSISFACEKMAKHRCTHLWFSFIRRWFSNQAQDSPSRCGHFSNKNDSDHGQDHNHLFCIQSCGSYGIDILPCWDQWET